MNFNHPLKKALGLLKIPRSTRLQPPKRERSEGYPLAGQKLLSGKNALITGAGQNIGKCIALEMAKQGANIFFTEINEEKRIRLEKELAGYEIQARGFLSDVSKTEEVDLLKDLLVENKIGVDILVNNVGITPKTLTIRQLDLLEWHKTFQTNIFGPIYLTKLITEMMMQATIPGSIIFITSIHQWVNSGWMSYSSSKAALGMMIQELALDLAPHGIRVNGIAPGWVKNDPEGNPRPDADSPLHHCSIPPEYIGRAAVYLASEYFSTFTTGTVLKIDGGKSLMNSFVQKNARGR